MRGLAKETIELLLFARALLAEFNPMTLRQLHYAIFSAAKIVYENTEADYKRLSRVTTKARRLYREHELAGYPEDLMPEHAIPPGWMVDELREAEMVNMWDDLAEYMDCVKTQYRRNNWLDQPNHVEVWSEKAAVLGSLRPITRKYGVRLQPCRGFGSMGMESKIGYRFEDIKRPITVLYVGDFDASGDIIDTDMHRRAQLASGKEFEMVRLAIHPADIKAFNLPPQKVKDSDSRAAAFKRKYGKNVKTIELDALPVEELRRRVTEAIEGLIDFDLWNRQIAVQEVELQCIGDFVDRVKNLPQVGR